MKLNKYTLAIEEDEIKEVAQAPKTEELIDEHWDSVLNEPPLENVVIDLENLSKKKQ